MAKTAKVETAEYAAFGRRMLKAWAVAWATVTRTT